MSRRSLTFRLVFWYCGLLLLLGTAFAAYTVINFDNYIRRSSRATLAARADALWAIGRPLLGDGPALAAQIEQRFSPESRGRFVRITLGDEILYVSGPPQEKDFDPALVPKPPSDGEARIERLDRLMLYGRGYHLADGRLAIIETGESTGMMDTVERGFGLSLLIGLPLLLILAAAGGYVLVQRALSPVGRMITAAEALTFNSPHNRLPLTGSGDRLDALGQSLNRMLERLDQAYQQASRLSADVAHELRTPLSIMRGELELAAGRSDLPPDLQAALGTTLDEAVRLSQIVESLIALSRLESIGGKRLHKPVDLAALAEETIDQMRLLAEEKDIALTGPGPQPVVVAGDRDRLKQVLVNLIDNAVKYTGTGGRVAVSVTAGSGKGHLAVADSGIGIAPDQQGPIFNRFYRVAADRGEAGAGLGLAIVKSIVLAHGGQVGLTSQTGQGSTFWVELPLADGEDLSRMNENADSDRTAKKEERL